jgi:hypothetical protein
MALNRQAFKRYIRDFNFRELFNEMGWNRDATSQSITVDGSIFALASAGEKSGFKILICSPDADGHVPDSATRKKIETRVRRLFPEHLIIFHDSAKSQQIWQWVSRQKDKPSRITETRWTSNQDPEFLFQRASGIFFELDEEDHITIVDVTSRVEANFDQNNERVTKRFYEVFKKQHQAFSEFLTGIDDHIDEWNRTHRKDKKENLNKQWYVSLMLNRLMFCYFIQKKGFLNRDKNYLRNKLAECKAKRGRNRYYSFYRDFLLALFHEGLGAPEHSNELEADIGTIPYLNGGLFDTHQLERDFDDIQIEDKAFEQIFDFFDKYEWHLDTTDNATGRDVNPDVIGYIFEKYINERAAMGAYYTKEDITDYISKNCILPFLFDETERNYAKAFKPASEIWSMLKNSGDQYIYDAVKHGVEVPYPSDIEKGLDTSKPDLLERRKHWNKPAPPEAALLTELWREVVDRRRRYNEAKLKIESGEITAINDFITHNLNIRQFVLDCIQNTTDPRFIEHFYKSIAGHIPASGTNERERRPISILDPTCGSGAFLFAALNILEELYSACLQRMEDFIDEEDDSNAEDRVNFKNQYAYFRRVLANVKDVQKHPNRQYFVYKSIILNNLFGVDIMKEAVEIAKLRLFLKLVATVDANYSKPNLGLEPLPDIDFNIRAGNTLVGFANEADLDNSLRSTVEGAIAKPRITEQMETVARAFARFKNSQVATRDYRTIKDDKAALFERLSELNDDLNRLFHEHSTSEDYEQWFENHLPFHWLAEFYDIVHDCGGFDVLLGNPPYIEYANVKDRYQIAGFESVGCNNLWAFVIERALKLRSEESRISFIVPMSLTSSKRMAPIQKMLSRRSNVWLSNYESGSNPGQLFVGVKQNLTILNVHPSRELFVWSTKFNRFYAEEREQLFSILEYTSRPDIQLVDFGFPKIGKPVQTTIFRKISGQQPLALQMTSSGVNKAYVHRIASYYIKAFDFIPYFYNDRDGQKKSEDYKEYCFMTRIEPVISVLNTSLFYLYWQVFFDNFKAGKATIEKFRFSPITDVKLNNELAEIARQLMEDLKSNAERISVYYQSTGNVEYDNFYPRLSKPIMDQADKLLAKHYGFTDEELDFIVNYDIKYRMGRELDGDEAIEE